MRETLRVWTEITETFVLEVILGQRRGKRAAIVRSILFLLSGLFKTAVKARRFLYNVRKRGESESATPRSSQAHPSSPLASRCWRWHTARVTCAKRSESGPKTLKR